MTKPSTTEPNRELLHKLALLVAQRAEVDQRLAAERAAALDAARDEFLTAESHIREESERDLARLNKRYDVSLKRLARRLDREIAAALSRRAHELGRFRSETVDLERHAREQAGEALWLAETVAETALRQAGLAHTAATKGLVTIAAYIQASERLGADLRSGVRPRGWPALPPIADLPQGPIREPIERAVIATGEQLRLLESVTHPYFARAEGILTLVVGCTGLGAAAAFAIRQPPTAWGLTVGTVSGLLVGAVAAAAFRVWSRRRIGPIAQTFSTSLANAKSLLEQQRQEVDRQRDTATAQIRARKDQESRLANARFNESAGAWEQRRTTQEPELLAGLDRDVAQARAKREDMLRRVEKSRDRRRAMVETRRDQLIVKATGCRDAAVAAAESAFARQSAELQDRWRCDGNQLLQEAARLREASRTDAPEWSAVLDCPARRSGEASDLIRYGWLSVDTAAMPGGLPPGPAFALDHPTRLDVPACLDLRGVGSILLHSTPETRSAAIGALQAVMLRLLTQLPPGKVRFIILDPLGLGQSFAGFMHLSDYEPLIVGDRIWTETRHIEQKLTDLTEHMEQVIQKYLRNQYASIQDYNKDAGEIAEPFRFLVIADFPTNFSEAAAKRLASIVSSGPRCGVFTLVTTDTRTRPGSWVQMSDVERGSVVLDHKEGRFAVRDPELRQWPLTLESPPQEEAFRALVQRVGELGKDSGRVQVPFAAVAPGPDEVWSRDSAGDLSIPVGRSGATRVQQLVLGRGTAQHALIAGRTGSGKSTLLHAIITSAALWYSPDQLELYLVDFKKGVEFKTYATNRLPHARVVAVESEREFGLSVLRRLDEELARRGLTFRNLGVQDLAGYRGTPDSGRNEPIRRVLLVVDEFQEFFVEDDKLAQEAMLLLDRLVRQGRAFGIHVVLGSQTIGGAYSLARSTIGQMAVRVALQCSEADSYLILSEDNPAARLLSRPGEAIYNDASGLIEGNSPFQVVWLPDQVRDQKLDDLRTRALPYAGKLPAPVVFEGNVPPGIETCRELADLLAGRSRPALPRVWLGDAVSIKEPTHATFRPQTASNLLIVGRDERAAYGLMVAAGLAIAGWSPLGSDGSLPLITLLDALSPEQDAKSPLQGLAELLAERGGTTYTNPRGADEAIDAIYRELTSRSGRERSQPAFLLIHGLQRFRSLRRAEDDFGFSGSSEGAALKPDQQLAQILRDGPVAGIHTIVWCDSASNLERALDRRAVRDFDLRVLFQMSGADSTALIDFPHAQSLGQHRALLFSEELGQFEKFRPYALPEADVLARLAGVGGAGQSGT